MLQVHEQADALLEEMVEFSGMIETAEAEAEREIESIRRRYAADIDPLKEILNVLDRDLVGLMKKQKAKVFDGKDTVKLVHGILLYARKMRVTIPKDALIRIEGQGWKEAIKLAKSVNRAVVEKWPDERLVVIGAKRKAKETFGYELKTEK